MSAKGKKSSSTQLSKGTGRKTKTARINLLQDKLFYSTGDTLLTYRVKWSGSNTRTRELNLLKGSWQNSTRQRVNFAHTPLCEEVVLHRNRLRFLSSFTSFHIWSTFYSVNIFRKNNDGSCWYEQGVKSNKYLSMWKLFFDLSPHPWELLSSTKKRTRRFVMNCAACVRWRWGNSTQTESKERRISTIPASWKDARLSYDFRWRWNLN